MKGSPSVFFLFRIGLSGRKFSGLLDDTLLKKKSSYRFGRLNALSKPIFSLIGVDNDFYGVADRVVVTDFVDILTVALFLSPILVNLIFTAIFPSSGNY